MSCQKGKKYIEAKTLYRKFNLRIDSSILILNSDTPRKYLYKIFSNKNELFAGYDETNASIQLYSLADNKQIGQFSLEYLDAHAEKFPIVSGLFVQNTDSIFVLSRFHITMLNSKGKILKSIPVNYNLPYFNDHYLMDYPESLSFFFDSSVQKFYVSTINPRAGAKSVDHFAESFITEVSFKGGNKFKPLPVNWSTLYQSDYYGFMIAPQFSFEKKNNKKALIYNFEIEPNIYSYDIASQKVKIIGGNPSRDTSLHEISFKIGRDEALNDEKKMIHLLENIRYYRILKIPGGYIRPFEKPVIYKVNSKGLYPNFGDKKRFLTVFDDRFNIIDNIDLNDRMYFLGRIFVDGNSIYIPYSAKGGIHFKIFNLLNL